MPHPYTRLGTPKITYVGERGTFSLFRIHTAQAERLDGLLYRGEITEALMRAGVEHRLGNYLPGIELPENPKSKDFFVLLPANEMRVLTDQFEVTGYMPGLFE